MSTPIFDQLESEFVEQGYPKVPLDAHEPEVKTQVKYSPFARACPKCDAKLGQKCKSKKDSSEMKNFHPERTWSK